MLAVAGAYDQRLTPPTREDAIARAVAWAQALHPAMPTEWAQQAVTRHYAEQTTVLMPAHLNHAWRAHRRAKAERDASRRALDTGEGVPMPEHVRDQWRRIVARLSEDT